MLGNIFIFYKYYLYDIKYVPLRLYIQSLKNLFIATGHWGERGAELNTRYCVSGIPYQYLTARSIPYS